MRMAAWHGADHIMVIRHMGQSHIDGLMEGTPQGIGGIPVTRKQVRAQRKALDIIEDEVGRPINYIPTFLALQDLTLLLCLLKKASTAPTRTLSTTYFTETSTA